MEWTGQPKSTWHIVDDLPDLLPVMRAEIEVIETYLSTVLDGPLRWMDTQGNEPSNASGKRGGS